jgi:hypothetical protein
MIIIIIIQPSSHHNHPNKIDSPLLGMDRVRQRLKVRRHEAKLDPVPALGPRLLPLARLQRGHDFD